MTRCDVSDSRLSLVTSSQNASVPNRHTNPRLQSSVYLSSVAIKSLSCKLIVFRVPHERTVSQPNILLASDRAAMISVTSYNTVLQTYHKLSQRVVDKVLFLRERVAAAQRNSDTSTDPDCPLHHNITGGVRSEICYPLIRNTPNYNIAIPHIVNVHYVVISDQNHF